MALVKSGWLWRQSSILRRWKKHWFDLWLDGSFVYYPDENRGNIEEKLLLKQQCLSVKSGAECGEEQPPEGNLQDDMLLLTMRDNTKIYLCAENRDDAVAWKMTLEDAKHFPVYVYDPYDDHYQAVPMNAHHSLYMDHGYGCGGYGGYGGYGPAMPRLLYREDPFERYGYPMSLGLMAGAVSGSAMSSLMWLPCWF